MCIQVKQLHKIFIFFLFLFDLKENLLKVFGHFGGFEDFSLAASFFKYSSTFSFGVSYFLLIVP